VIAAGAFVGETRYRRKISPFIKPRCVSRRVPQSVASQLRSARGARATRSPRSDGLRVAVSGAIRGSLVARDESARAVDAPVPMLESLETLLRFSIGLVLVVSGDPLCAELVTRDSSDRVVVLDRMLSL
jgi:hypothetical protein